MANIYVLQGAGNKGKSTTLITLRINLETRNNITPVYQISFSRNNKPIDTEVILPNIRTQNGGTVRVGIMSHGDTPERIEKALNNFLSNNCDIIFCACHSSGMTVNAINLFRRGNTIDFIQQVIQNNAYNVPNTNITMQDRCNNCMADHLIDMAGL